MQLVLGIVIGLAVGAAAAYVVARFVLSGRVRAAAEERDRLLADAERDGEAIRRESQVAAREEAIKLRADVDQEVKDRQAEIIRIETRALEKEEEVDRKLGEFGRREQSLSDREGALARLQVDLEQAKEFLLLEL
jgi:ribonuclease Y